MISRWLVTIVIHMLIIQVGYCADFDKQQILNIDTLNIDILSLTTQAQNLSLLSVYTQEIEPRKSQIRQFTPPQLQNRLKTKQHGEVLIIYGPAALQQLPASPLPYQHIVLTLINQADYRRLRSHLTQAHTVLFTNQPAARQLLLAKTLLPRLHHIGVLYNQYTREDVVQLQTLAKSLNISIIAIELATEPAASGSFRKPIHQLIAKSDAILAIDNSTIYNPSTIGEILLTAYRHNKVVIGLNKAYVDAGVLAATYSDITAYSQALADILSSLKPGDRQIKEVFATTFDVAINHHLASSMDFVLPEVTAIKQRIQGPPSYD